MNDILNICTLNNLFIPLQYIHAIWNISKSRGNAGQLVAES